MIQCEHVKKEYGRKTALADFRQNLRQERLLDFWDRTEVERQH